VHCQSTAPQDSPGAKGATFVNWRGFFASPDLPRAQARNYQVLLQQMQTTPAWQALRERYGWVDLYRAGPDFVALLDNQERRLHGLLTELGLL